MVHRVGISDDVGFVRLAEHLRQRHPWNAPAAYHVGKHIARPHGGQLIGVPDHHQPAPRPQRRQQRLHQRQIHHAHFVHQHGVRLQRVVHALLIGHLPRQVVKAHAQGSMYGLRLPPAQLRHALSRPSRGRQQQDVQPHDLKQPHNGSRGGGFSRAWAAREQQHAGLRRQKHRFLLQRRIPYALRHFHLADDLVHLSVSVIGKLQHFQQLFRHKALRRIQLRQIAGQDVGHLLLADNAAAYHDVQADLHRLGGQPDELLRRPDELFPRQKYMAVPLIILQFIQQRRLNAASAVAVKAHAQRHLVRSGKLHAELLPRQKIGVFPQPVQRLRSVDAMCLHRQMHRQVVPRHELHGAPQPRQLPKRTGQLHGLLVRDAPDDAQLFRLLLQHPQGVRAELRHQLLRRGLSHALEKTGGQIAHHLLFFTGQTPLHMLAGDLPAVQGMGDPHPRNGHSLAGRGIGDAPHRRDHLPQLRQQGEHRVSVFLILEDHRLNGSLHCASLTHGFYPLYSTICSSSSRCSTVMRPNRRVRISARCRPSGVSPQSTIAMAVDRPSCPRTSCSERTQPSSASPFPQAGSTSTAGTSARRPRSSTCHQPHKGGNAHRCQKSQHAVFHPAHGHHLTPVYDGQEQKVIAPAFFSDTVPCRNSRIRRSPPACQPPPQGRRPRRPRGQDQ